MGPFHNIYVYHTLGVIPLPVTVITLFLRYFLTPKKAAFPGESDPKLGSLPPLKEFSWVKYHSRGPLRDVKKLENVFS